MFDVVRIDKDHTGIYIADAVGHGLAASLLTMFIKRAIVPKREADHGHTVLDPAEVLTVLNDVLAEQSLPNCQFVTACYAVLDHRTLTLRYARGGHPAPLHLAVTLAALSAGAFWPAHRLLARLLPAAKREGT